MWTTQYRMLRVGLSIFSFQAVVPFVCVFYVYCRLGIRAYSLYLLLCTWYVCSPIYLSADPTVLVAACPGGCEAFSSFCYTLFQVSNEQNPLPSTHFKETDSRHPSMPSRDKKMAESPVTTVRGPCVDLAYAPQPNNQARTPPHKPHPTFVAPPPAQWWLVNATRQTRQEIGSPHPPDQSPRQHQLQTRRVLQQRPYSPAKTPAQLPRPPSRRLKERRAWAPAPLASWSQSPRPQSRT